MKKKIIGIVVILLVIQVFQTDKGPYDIKDVDKFITVQQPPEFVAEILKSACYDCHSYETKYTWYTYVAPVSWWTAGHVRNGRKKLNFSTWGQYASEDQKHMLYECAEKIQKGHMPPKGYVRMHSAAHIEEAQKAKLIAWFKKNSQ